MPAYQWPSSYPQYAGTRNRLPSGWKARLRTLADWLCARHAYRWPTAFPQYLGRYGYNHRTLSESRRPAIGQRIACKCFGWLFATSAYDCSTDFPEFASAAGAVEAHQGPRLKKASAAIARLWHGLRLCRKSPLASVLLRSYIAGLRKRTRFLSGVLALLLLLPVPAFAALTLQPWAVYYLNSAGNPVGPPGAGAWTATGSGTGNLNVAIQGTSNTTPLTGGPISVIAYAGVINSSTNVTVTTSGFNHLNVTAGNVQVTIGFAHQTNAPSTNPIFYTVDSTLFPRTGNSNQFSGVLPSSLTPTQSGNSGTTANASYAIVRFTFANGSTWTSTTTPSSTINLTFTGP
jgi:hypothetical protein